MIVDPWGLVLAQAADAETVDRRRPRPRRARTRSARGCPRWPTAAPRPTAGPTPDGHPQRAAGRREAAPDPRRRRARLRPPGLHTSAASATSPTRPASPTGSSTTTSAPRTRCSTRSSSSAGTSCSTSSASSTARTSAPREKLYAIAVVHRRLLPPRPRPDEGHHRRGHAGGELVRPDAPGEDHARPTTLIAGIVEQAQADGRVQGHRHAAFAAMAFYGAIEQVLTGWIFEIAAARRGRVRARPRRSSSRRSAAASTLLPRPR